MSEPASGLAAKPLRYFQQVAHGLDVSQILREVEAASEFWDENTARTAFDDSPMAGTSDMWLRYFPRETLAGPENYLGEGRPEFWPAWHRLPALHDLAFGLMRMVQGVELGVGLISRIPAGGEVKTHTDGAGWTARFYDAKFYVPLQACAACINRTLDEEVVMLPGTVWSFNNLVPHSVHNNGAADRINVILTMRGARAETASALGGAA